MNTCGDHPGWGGSGGGGTTLDAQLQAIRWELKKVADHLDNLVKTLIEKQRENDERRKRKNP